jgi:molybdate/tungstate transport system substrate-binding protein
MRFYAIPVRPKLLWLSTLAIGLCVTSNAFAQGSVTVLYAGSLVGVMEQAIGPAFTKQTGIGFQGHAGGSKGLAAQIKAGSLHGDVFVSADPRVNADLTGGANGDRVSWYISFAQSPLVLGFSPSSRFAADWQKMPWYEVLMKPGIKIGRTDPNLDPKGALTVELLKKAEASYKKPGLSQHVLDAPVLPEETLVSQVQSGALDVGFFYSTETTGAKLPSVGLPSALTPKAVYTVTILPDAQEPKGADRFVVFLLGPSGRALLEKHGLTAIKLQLSGAPTAVPESIRALLNEK